MSTGSTTLYYNLAPAPGLQQSLNQQLSKIEQGLRFKLPFQTEVEGIKNFTSELDRANQRVITLGLAFQTLRTTQQIFTGIVSSALEVEKAFTDINSVFDLTSTQMDKFGKNLFNIARETSTSFKIAAEAAKEFSRQGLSSEETLVRTKNALTLSRVANLDVAKAVDVLTASINGFTNAGITSADVTNKLLAVDTRFAVSVKDLSEALARAGASASDAGVGFDELLGIITAVQQTTARGGAVIGQSLKTIFTRIERKDTLDSLQSLGVAVKDVQGNTLPAMKLLENFAERYNELGEASKKSAAELVGGVYQINILKAAVADLAKQRSIYAGAVDASKRAGDEELIRNEALNKSLQSTIERLGLAGKQIGSNVANLGFSSFARNGLSLLTDNPITKALEDASGNAETTGGKIAEMFIKGFGNALVFGLGPIFLTALSKITSSTFSKIKNDLFEVSGLSASSKEQLMIQEQINFLYKNGDSALKAQLLTMTSLNDKAALLANALSTIQSRNLGVQSEIQALAPLVFQTGYRPIPRSAEGYVPFSEESMAISNGIGGAPKNASPRLISNFNFGSGKVGPMVANTSEYIVPNFAGGGSAIFNQSMISKYGLPPGSTPIAAGGYIPNAANGINYSPNIDFQNMSLRSSLGQFISNADVAILKGLFDSVAKAASAEKAKDIGKKIIDFTMGLNALSQAKILNNLGYIYSRMHREENAAEMLQRQGGFMPSANTLRTYFQTANNPKVLGRTYPEEYFGKDFFALTKAGLSESIGGQRVTRSDMDRFLASQQARKISNANLYDDKGLKPINLSKALTASSALAENQTIYEQFNETIRKNINSGKSLYEAYEKAVKQLEKETDNRGIIRQIISKSIPTNTEAFKILQEENTQRKAAIRQQVIYNEANARIMSGTTFQKLTATQKDVLLQDIRRGVMSERGFGAFSYEEIESKAKRTGGKYFQTAQSQIDAGVDARIALLNSKAASAASSSNLGWFGRMRQGVNENAGLVMSLLLPMAAGFVPEGRGGTAGGMGSGFLTGALNGGGFGASIGNLLPVVGPAAGLGIGAAIGGAIGLISKMTESFDEMMQKIDDMNKRTSNDFQNFQNFLNLEEQKQNALSLNQYGTAALLQKQQMTSFSSIQDKKLLDILNRSGLNLTEKGSAGQEVFVNQSATDQIVSSLRKVGKRSGIGFIGQLLSSTNPLQGDTLLSGLFKPGEKDVQRNTVDIKNIFSNKDIFSKEDLIAIKKQTYQDPTKALEMIVEKAGLNLKDFEEEFKYLDANTIKNAIISGMREAVAYRNAPANASAPIKSDQQISLEQKADYLSMLRNRSYENQLQYSSEKELSSVRQKIALENPLVGNEMARLKLARGFEMANMQRESQFQKTSTIESATQALFEYAKNKKIVDPKIYERITQIKDIEDLVAFEGLAKTQAGVRSMPGLIDEKSLTIIGEAIDKYYALDKSEKASLRTGEAITKMLADQIEYRQSLIGAIDLEQKSVNDLDEEIRVAKQQNAGQSVIEDLQGKRSVAEMRRLRRTGLFNITEGDVFRSEYMRSTLEQGRNQMRNSQAFIDAMNNPTDRQAYIQSEVGKEDKSLEERLTAARVKLEILKKINATMEDIVDQENDIKIKEIEADRKAGKTTETRAYIDTKKIIDTAAFEKMVEKNKRDAQAAREMNLDQETIFDFETKTKNDQIEALRRLGPGLGGISDKEAALRTSKSLAERTLAAEFKGGAETESALYGYAATRGKYGDSAGSFMGGFNSVFAGLRKEMDQFADVGKRLANSLESSLGNAFGDFVTGAKSAKQAFRDFTVSVLADASRALASKAVQNMLGMALGSFGGPAGATGGEFSGGAFRFASGGTVPALLTGGEYYISPKAAKSIGYDTLRQINRYAEGGMVRGGSGVRDDVPAHLAPGSFIVKKSVVDRLGPQYFDSLVNNHVQKRFFGGFLMGALLGGGLGYAVGGKKGALIGAGIGALGGGLYQNFAQTGSIFSSGSGSSMFSFAKQGASGAGGVPFELNATVPSQYAEALAEAPSQMNPFTVSSKAASGLSQFQKMGLMLGGAGVLGLAARAMAPKEPSANLLTPSQVGEYRKSLESQQQDKFSNNAFAYLSINPQGGYSLGSFGVEPATRRWADGGEVGGVSDIGAPSGGGQAPSVNVKIEINNNGQVSSSSSASGKDQFGADFGQKIEKAVRPIVQDEIVRQMRNDGMLTQRSRYVS